MTIHKNNSQLLCGTHAANSIFFSVRLTWLIDISANMHWRDFPLGVELMMLVHTCALFSVPLEVQELTFFLHLGSTKIFQTWTHFPFLYNACCNCKIKHKFGKPRILINFWIGMKYECPIANYYIRAYQIRIDRCWKIAEFHLGFLLKQGLIISPYFPLQILLCIKRLYLSWI